MGFTIKWIDAGREPRVPPNPRYPKGVDLDMSDGARETCSTKLPYPARRCGAYSIECSICGRRVMVTTAGRADDPRSIKISCMGGFR